MIHAIDPTPKPGLGVVCTCGKRFPVPKAIEAHIEKENAAMETPPEYKQTEEDVASTGGSPAEADTAKSEPVARATEVAAPEPKEIVKPVKSPPMGVAKAEPPTTQHAGDMHLDLRDMTLNQINFIGKTMAASGMFMDVKDPAKALVKILAGQEIGVTPFQAMTNIHIIQGKATMSANLMAAKVKGSKKYDYRVVKMENDKCSIDFYELSGDKRDPLGNSSFTLEDADAAGTQNLTKFARNMLFARAMSNGCKWYTPDVFNGNLVYTPEELGAKVDEDGEVIQ